MDRSSACRPARRWVAVILYNKKIYEQLGLSVPKTWAEFEANNEKIKAAGIAPVAATYGDTWTSQLFVLADYYNVAQANPNFAADYTANKAKYATTPGAMAGFSYLQEGFEKGWYQKDFATTKFEQGLKMLADGELPNIRCCPLCWRPSRPTQPDKVNDIGFFGQPGTDASKNCATIWMPAGTISRRRAKNLDVAKDFLAFIASTAGVDAINAKVPPQPVPHQGNNLPEDVLPGVQGYCLRTSTPASRYPALEFLSPIKGPNLEQICVAVGTGQMAPTRQPRTTMRMSKKQAQQLGLPGW